MDGIKRKNSPRAPTLSLDEAIARTAKIYKEEGRHAAPAEVAMRHIGYTGKNGAALSALASLGYWGLIERPRDGLVMITKPFEDYEFTPDEEHKRQLLIEFVRNPPLFASLLDQYQERLPSEATLKYDLIQRGFNPNAAAVCMAVFKRSVEFARYFEKGAVSTTSPEANQQDIIQTLEASIPAQQPENGVMPSPVILAPPSQSEPERQSLQDYSGLQSNNIEPGIDRIPIRLAGGRRAWLEIPTPFFSADKKRLKKHIDLLLTDDEEELEDEDWAWEQLPNPMKKG